MSISTSETRMIEERQNNAREVLSYYASLIESEGEPLDLILMDLLADLRHMVDSFKSDEVECEYKADIQWQTLNDMAMSHYLEETTELQD